MSTVLSKKIASFVYECLHLMSYQQLRSHGDEATALKKRLIRQTREAGHPTCDPSFTR